MNDKTLWDQLERVVEPCSLAMGKPMSICDMGLVQSIEFDAGVARVVLCLTDPGCVNYGQIRQYITDELLAIEGVESVQVSLTTTELWTPDWVRDQARLHPVFLVPRTPAATTQA